MSMYDEMNDLFECGVGVDWGTFSSLVAVQEIGEHPKVADYTGENRNGIPSLFYRSKTGVEYCAEKAVGPGKSDPANTCRSVKMKLSEPTITLNGHSYTPTEIAVKQVCSIMDTSVKAFEQDFIEFDPKDAKIVCGVPVRFNAAERGQVEAIMKNATGNNTVRLVSEPILALLAYDHFLKRKDHRPVLCFDCGAGTFDAAVLRKTPEGETPYTVCDGSDGLRIAGDRLDELTAELILEKLRQSPANQELCKRLSDPTFTADYYIFHQWQAREMKEALSDNMSYRMPITLVTGGESAIITVTREEFEEKIRSCIRQMVDKAYEVLMAAGLGTQPDISILLVGGSCRIPLIKQMLQEKFTWVKDILLRNPQQMVALGAAIYANQPRKLLIPKVSFGYAVDTYVPKQKKSMLNVCIPSDVTLPYKFTSYYDTRFEGQSRVGFQLYEVSHGAEDALLEMDEGQKMGIEYKLTHEFGKSVPKGTAVQLDCELNEDGILTMTVDDISISGKRTVKTFTITNTMQTGRG